MLLLHEEARAMNALTPFEEVMAARGKGMPAEGEVTITGNDPV